MIIDPGNDSRILWLDTEVQFDVRLRFAERIQFFLNSGVVGFVKSYKQDSSSDQKVYLCLSSSYQGRGVRQRHYDIK